MKNLCRYSFLLGLLFPIPVCAGMGVPKIFDGKSLNQWDGDPRYWRVENGAITGETTTENPLERNTFLIWRGGELGDFELMLEYRIHGGNSGIQYRSWENPEKLGKWVVGGYQADVDSPSEPRWCGSLYEEQGRGFLAERGQRTIVDEDQELRIVGNLGDADELYSHINFEDWNCYRIVAKGYHFLHEINGHTMIDSIDEDLSERRKSGVLAFQLHWGEPMKLEIRNIWLKQCVKENRGGASPCCETCNKVKWRNGR